MSNQFDLVLRGGTVVDGTGGAPFEADVAISAGLIAEVGPVSGRGREEIEAQGRLVIPGFVDVHTHYDAQATWANELTPSTANGVTTLLMGNCGVGFAPVRSHQRDMLISLMEGVEDIPEVVLNEGLTWAWDSFPDYLDYLGNRRYDVDLACQVPHAALRVYVMGERGARREPATPEDCAAMAQLTAEGLAAGAFGFSTSRLLQHRTAAGEPVPSYGAAEAELAAIADALRNSGHGWLQVVADFGENQAEEFGLLERLAARAQRPLTLTLLQRDSWPLEWRELLSRIERANAQGHRITGQVRGRPTSTLLGFELTRNPFARCASWSDIALLPPSERRAAVLRPDLRARLLAEVDAYEAESPQARARWLQIFPLGDPPDYEPELGSSIGARAEREGVSPAALAYDAMCERGGRGILYHPTTNYSGGDMSAVYEMLGHPNTLVGLGDGGAHVGIMCDTTAMVHALTHWTRDRTRGPRRPLEDMVRRLTAANAEAMGLHDRGVVARGKKADLNVLDYDGLQLEMPEIHYDLPAGGKRLQQTSSGIEATVLSGVVVRRHGEPTGALPGRLVRAC